MRQTGNIISIKGQVAEVTFTTDPLPALPDVLVVADNHNIKLEVISSSTANTFYCLILSTDTKIPRGTEVINTQEPLMIPVGEGVLGRVLDIFSKTHDSKGPINNDLPKRPLFTNKTKFDLDTNKSERKVIETGIKAIDFFSPLLSGGKTGIIGGAGTGKTVILTELVNRLVIQKKEQSNGVAVFSAVGERSREAQELYQDLKEAQVMDHTNIVLGQMGENPAIRFRTAFAGATIAEYFRDEMKKDVFFFMDNIYRFAQAGYELAMSTNSIPSEDGYQPTLGSEMADLQERLISSPTGTITSFMALFVPSDDMTDYGVRSVFPYLDTMLILSREIFQTGRYPAVDLLKSTSVALNPNTIGEAHYDAYIASKKILQKSFSLEKIVSLIGESELDPENQKIYKRSKIITNFMTQDLFMDKSYKGKTASFIPIAETVQSIQDTIDGKYDDVDPEKFKHIGSINNLK